MLKLSLQHTHQQLTHSYDKTVKQVSIEYKCML